MPPIAAVAVLGLMGGPTSAHASSNQIAMFEDDPGMYASPASSLQTIKELGAQVVRVSVPWNRLAPSPFAQRVPNGFQPADPGSPLYDWTALDRIVETGQQMGITIDLSLTGGAPMWAVGAGMPRGGRYPEWRPSASQYGAFVRAVSSRYSGRYVPAGASAPLPRIGFWEIWNEPNFGQDLAPQAVAGSRIPTGPALYRALVDAAWSGLSATGHRHDMVLLGNLAARGLSGRPTRRVPLGYPGNFGNTKPLAFIRSLYCLDGRLHPLRGRTAAQQGCPTTAAGSRAFPRAHPALFAAPGFADHPYPLTQPPDRADTNDPDYSEFSQLPRFIATVDRVERAYRSGHRFAIYNNEYGYITNPPDRTQRFPSPSVAAAWINWAEYISWLNPRIASTMQYLLHDPLPGHGGFDTGLLFSGGAKKPTYNAYRLAVYVPQPRALRRHSILVWGCARPAGAYGNRNVIVQFQRGGRGPFTRLSTVTIHNVRGYFETRITPPASGVIRLAWSYPAAPPVYSRTVPVTVR